MEKGGLWTFIDSDRVMERHREVLPKSIDADNELWRLPFRKKIPIMDQFCTNTTDAAKPP